MKKLNALSVIALMLIAVTIVSCGKKPPTPIVPPIDSISGVKIQPSIDSISVKPAPPIDSISGRTN